MIVVYTLILNSIVCISKVVGEDYDLFANILGIEENLVKQQIQDAYYLETKVEEQVETIDLKLYYECLCPDCIDLDRKQLKNIINVLSSYVNIKTYPYGNAKTIEINGKVEFKCQHGPKECYGNKLHACSLQHISNHKEALLFNVCMMDPNNKTRGSDDATAAKCAGEMHVNKDNIFQCAQSKEGTKLLKYYGEESTKAHFQYVPYVLINGNEWKGTDLMQDICAAFKNPPEPCRQKDIFFIDDNSI